MNMKPTADLQLLSALRSPRVSLRETRKVLPETSG